MKYKSFYEASVPQGLEESAWAEINQKSGGRAKLIEPIQDDSGVLAFTYGDNPGNLLRLKSVLSLFSGQRFDVPRPKALLGHENFQNMLEQIEAVIKLASRGLPTPGAYHSLYVAAAGSDSSVMQRLAEDIAAHFKLRIVRDEGDLLVRFRRSRGGEEGWEVLVRMTPRPLSVRRWRTCDYEGALNAAVAHVMARFTRPAPEDVFLNIACGSGTLLIERAAVDTARELVGCDPNPQALTCAQANIQAAGYEQRIQVYPWDARSLPLAEASVDVVCADLPFGHDVGSHEENLILYPQLLKEAARVARPGARAVFITHEIRLMETVLNISTDWETQDIYPIAINGLNPRIYVLNRPS